MIISFRLFCGVVQLRCSRSISQPSGDFQYYPHSSLVEICNDFIMRQPSAHEMGAAFWSSCLPKRREPFSGLGKVLKSREASGTNKFWRSISSSLISNMFPCLFVLFMTFCERLGGGAGRFARIIFLTCLSKLLCKQWNSQKTFVGANTCVFILPSSFGYLPTPGS